MHLLQGLESLRELPAGNALSVGNFDGVHLGHRKIIDTLCAASCHGCVVVTFEPHPLGVLRPSLVPPRITSIERKRELLAAAGVTHLVELPADDGVLGMSAVDFWQTIRDDARPAVWAEGRDFRFGKGATGNVDQLRAWAEGSGVRVQVVEPADVVLPGLQVAHASSSLARWLLAHGRVLEATAVLGRPHELVGEVVHGQKRGREIGFPTANVAVADHLVPADAIYAATAVLEDGTEHAAALSIGTNPTFAGEARTVEAFLIDFAGDLYGRRVTLRVERWLRGQVKYAGVDALVEQLHTDVGDTRRLLTRAA